jgi:hypothetical protein
MPLDIRVAADRVEVAAGPGMERPIEVGCRGRRAVLEAGSIIRFEVGECGGGPGARDDEPPGRS